MNEKKQKRNPEETRQAILDAAQKLFIEHGCGRVSISRIARMAGVTKSLVHHHFQSKENLWRLVKIRLIEGYVVPQRNAFANSKTDLGFLEQSMRNYFSFLMHNRDLVRLMSWMDLEEDADLVDYLELIEMGAARIRERQGLGEIRPDLEPRLILITVLNMVIHWFKARSQWLGEGSELAQDTTVDHQYLEVMLKIFFEGIKPQNAAPASGANEAGKS